MGQGQYTLEDIQQPATPAQTGQYSAADIDESPQQPQQPSWWDKAKLAASGIVPGTAANQLAGQVQQWAQSKEPLNNPSASSSPTMAALKQMGTGALADVAGLVKGATSPTGRAATAASIVAPEVMGPAFVAHGVYSGIKGWGDLSNPDVLQGELNAGAEVAGGAAMTGAAVKAGGGPITQGIKSKIVSAKTPTPEESTAAFQRAIPPSRSTPYQDIDLQKAQPYLKAEHASAPIDSVEATRDAADSAIGKIEDKISQKISQLPPAKIRSNAIQDVTQSLSQNARGQSFVNAGLKDLEDFSLDQPKTVEQWDDIRAQLNAENKAILKKNNYDIATALKADPGFAARSAAAESIRNGIYDHLAANGMPEARALRLDEGSLIKIRNAAQNQIFNGAKKVSGTATIGTVGKIAKGVTQAGLTGAGAAVGGWPGAIVGREAGEIVSPLFGGENMTRDALIEKAFSK